MNETFNSSDTLNTPDLDTMRDLVQSRTADYMGSYNWTYANTGTVQLLEQRIRDLEKKVDRLNGELYDAWKIIDMMLDIKHKIGAIEKYYVPDFTYIK